MSNPKVEIILAYDLTDESGNPNCNYFILTARINGRDVLRSQPHSRGSERSAYAMMENSVENYLAGNHHPSHYN